MFKQASLAVITAMALAAPAIAFCIPAYAQVDPGTKPVEDVIKLTEKDPREIAAEIINVAISFLSIIFVLLILRAGFLFMISGGDKEKTDKAKRSIVNAIIGLALILSAWSISTYAIDALINAVQ